MIEPRSTKQLLADSFIDLSRSKSIDKITVSDIVKNCGAGRQTFYNYFPSKYDLVYWICDESCSKIMNEWVGKEPWGRTLGRVLEKMQTLRTFYYKAFRQNDYMQIYEHFYRYCIEYYRSSVRTILKTETLSRELDFEIEYTSYACVNISKAWNEGQIVGSAEEVGMLLYKAMSPILKEIFTFE